MSNEKIENQLNLALDATNEEREKSLELDVGYDSTERTWEVIVKFGGTTEELKTLLRENFSKEYEQIRVTNLQNEYAILLLPESIVTAVAALPQIEYMEKPKSLFFAVNQGKQASCINPLQTAARQPTEPGAGVGVPRQEAEPGAGAGMPRQEAEPGAGAEVPRQLPTINPRWNDLTGADCIVAVIDSGIDYSHPDFRNGDGTTRILNLWDQTIPAGSVPDVRQQEAAPTEQAGSSGEEAVLLEQTRSGGQEFLQAPEGYYLGTEFPREVINRALEQPTEQQRYAICPSRDISGHGTHVTGIAAGNGRASEGRYRGIAFGSELIIVKLGNPQAGGFPRTTELMQAVDYCMRMAEEYGRPIVLNLSFGNNYGGHAGTSLIETYLNDISNYWKSSIVIGSGNEGASAVHTSGVVQMGQNEVVEIAVSEYEPALNLQIWKDYVDEMAVSLAHPNGSVIGPIRRAQGAQRFTLGNTQILLYYGEPSPYSPYQEIYFDFIPVRDYIDSGIWEIRLVPQRIVSGEYDMWLPSGGVLNAGTGFLFPIEETTLTIPSTAEKVITVGAYDARFNQPATFSGRGYTRATKQVKPDLVAPGVEITSCAPGGGYTSRTGTSMATPFVTGGAALLMEWGIVRGNDAYLYGEKMKAYLIRGARRDEALARQLPTGSGWPNPQLGWGTLCVRASLPV